MQHSWKKLEEQLVIRNRIRESLVDWATWVLSQSGQRLAAHHRLLLQELTSLTKGEFDRLMILMPPGSAKSTYASILFPAWWFTQYPDSSIIGTSHTFSLARHFSSRLRHLITLNETLLGYRVMPQNRAAGSWQISSGGQYYVAGIGGGITGRRADLAIIDDPVKSAAEAESSKFRSKVLSWYRSELLTRLKPGARVVLIMTRWHEDDLGGQVQREGANAWHVLRLPALAEDHDPLGRVPGEPLWPSWESYEELIRKRDAVGTRVWMALFQQSPSPTGSRLFNVKRIAILEHEEVSQGTRLVRAWDLAATTAVNGNDPDWTVGVKLAQRNTGHFTVHDVVRLRGTPREVEDLMIRTAREDGPSVWVGLPEDPGQAGKSQISYLVSRFAGYKILASRETGSKMTRALPLASQVEAQNLAIIRAGWNRDFLEELDTFPYGRKDDQVDALVRGFNTLLRVSDPAKKIMIPHLER